jgi:hypothetical protein
MGARGVYPLLYNTADTYLYYSELRFIREVSLSFLCRNNPF